MSHTVRIWKPETRFEDCSDWITPEDVCRHALAAYYLARESMKQPPGRRFVDVNGTRWSTRASFGENLALCFGIRVKTDGYHLGVEPEWSDDAKQLQAWTRPMSWHPEFLLEPELDSELLTDSGGMGRSPMSPVVQNGPVDKGRSASFPELSSMHSSSGPVGPLSDAANRP